MRENMDQMLQQVRDYVFQTDEALKEAQRSFSRSDGGGAGQVETIALKGIRDDIWALEDKVRAAKWATSAAEQAELANQIDPLMLQVLSKCQQHRDQVKACQGLLTDIVSWCERGTSAYRFTVHESAVSKATSTRYSTAQGASDGTLQGKALPASRIPAYKSPTKQAKAAGKQQQQQPQQQSQAQQQLTQLKAHSRIPQPQARRQSLPDAEQQCSTQDQAGREPSSTAAAPKAAAATDGGKVLSSAARIQRGLPPVPTPAAATGAAANRSSGVVAAAAAAFESAQASSTSAVPDSAPTAVPVEPFVPLDLDADDDDQLLLQAPPVVEQQAVAVAKAQERVSGRSSSNSSCGSGSGLGSLQSRGSAGRVQRSLLQLGPSRDDVALSSAGQLLQQSSAAMAQESAHADAYVSQMAAPGAQRSATTSATGASASAAGSLSTALRFSGSLQSEGGNAKDLSLLKVPRASYADNTLPPADPAADFSDFGPLPSFTPLVSQQAAGRVSNPFAASGGGYMMERSSLRTSQDISMLLRSGMLMEAALLSSNASRMHIIHDAVAKKPVKPEGEPEVPVVPHRLAVHKRRPWWAQAARVVVGTAAMAVAGAAGAAAAAKHQQAGDGQADHGLQGLLRPLTGHKGGKGSQHQRRQQQQALEEPLHQLPFVPLGPAPDASAGCG